MGPSKVIDTFFAIFHVSFATIGTMNAVRLGRGRFLWQKHVKLQEDPLKGIFYHIMGPFQVIDMIFAILQVVFRPLRIMRRKKLVVQLVEQPLGVRQRDPQVIDTFLPSSTSLSPRLEQ